MLVKQLTISRRVGRFLCLPILVLLCFTTAKTQGDGLGCIGTVNLSLDANTCSAIITPDMIVNPSDYDPATYTYEVLTTDLSDVAIPNDFGLQSLGQQIKAGVRATNTVSGQISNFCWSFVNIEYKFVPEIVCMNPMTGSGVIVSCLADPANYPRPTFTSSCGVASEVVQVGVDVVENVCDPADPETVAKITRSYQAVNVFGGFSNICTVEYSVKAFNLAQVTFPNIGTSGGCSDEELLTDPANLGTPFHLSATGSGTGGMTTFDTTYLFPTPNTACNILVSMENDTIAQDECEIKVLRTWTIQQWLCNNQEKIAQREQLITLRDTDGPAFTCPTDTIQARASGTTCKAFVNMPMLQVDESCSAVRSVTMSYLPEGTSNSNGGSIRLPVGIHTVTYTAIDECNNESTCDVIVNVSDGAPPVVICEQHVAISLTNNGTAHVPASVFDDGSYGCGFKNVLAAKMGPDVCGDTIVPNPIFADHVKFCCVEANPDSPIMVRLRAYNHDGSFTECMSEITINDKNSVSLVCPTSLEVSCEFVYDDSLAIFGKVATVSTDRDNIVIDADSVSFAGGVTAGRDGLAIGGCDMDLDEIIDIDAGIISCGTGLIKRTFTLSNENGSRSCTQTINIIGGSNFDGIIAWPRDTTLDIACGVADISPDLTGRPIFTEGDCQQLAATYVDETFSNVEIDGTCRKIFRYWSIIDWCNSDPVTGQPDRYPRDNEGRYLQVIKVVKNQRPVVMCAGSDLFESVESSCLVSEVNLSATVSGCPNTTEYSFEFFLDLDCDGSIDSVGSSSNYLDTVIAGDHCITWTATDLCGNVSAPCTHDFKVRNNKGPSAVCIANLTVTLDSMDVLGNDGVLDTVMAVLWADDIDSGSSQSCGNPISFSFSRDSIVNGLTFNCSQASSRQRVGLYVFDDLTGNVGECWSEIEVQDLLGRCGSRSPGNNNFASVSGLITTESGENIGQAEVTLVGSELPENTTNANGQYAFSNMPMGGAYTVVTQKDHDHVNGVSTLDLVMIQKHILGLDLLDSPYKMIAADINKSNSISGSDIVELRKLILGEYAEFTSNTSWRFVDKEYGFPIANNPWSEIFPEAYDIASLNQSMTIDFVGVKVGDVSGNASADNINVAEVRTSQEPLKFIADVVQDERENLVNYKFSSTNFDKVLGFQTTLKFDPAQLAFEGISSNSLNISNDHIGVAYIDKGMIALSWSDADAPSFDESDELFELVFRQIGSMAADGLLATSNITNTEAYFKGSISDQIELTITRSGVEGLTLNQNEPNPWSEQTNINFSIQESGYVGFNIVDLSGKLIATKSNYFKAGSNSILIDRRDVPSAGLYLYEIYSQGSKVTKKMIIID